MKGCPAAPMVERRWLFFRRKEHGRHNWRIILMDLGSGYWSLDRECPRCYLQESYTMTGAELMDALGLKHLPHGKAISIYGENDLRKQKCYYKPRQG